MVWSPAGPVLGVSVGPDPLIQSSWSSAPCTQTHRPSSKEQLHVDRAEDAKEKCEISQNPSRNFIYTLKQLFTRCFVGFFAVSERDVIYCNDVISSGGIGILQTTEPNLNQQIISPSILTENTIILDLIEGSWVWTASCKFIHTPCKAADAGL